MVTVAEDRGQKRVVLGAEMGGRNWPPSLHRPAQPQFRLLHPQVRLKQQYLRLATVAGSRRKILMFDYMGIALVKKQLNLFCR